MVNLFKIIRKKILIKRWFKSFVKNNEVLKKDISQTCKVRNFKKHLDTLEKQFYHLMMYYPEFAYVFFWRTGLLNDRNIKLFSKDFKCKIFGSTIISGGLMCYHPFASVINATSIGENFQFRNSLTIGNKNNDNSKLPIIGSDVVVGANVVIIGDITIGDNVTIGAGSVVVKDIESNTIVAGNPAKVLRYK